MTNRKPIISVDFDGVLHSYTSGWEGPRNIPDPPVDGALEWLADIVNHFDVQIFSSRSRYLFARRAMKRWLTRNYLALAPSYSKTPSWLREIIARNTFEDPWWVDAEWTVRKQIVGRIGFPLFKPPALLTLDDRAMLFDGLFPTPDVIRAFRPWNK